MRRIIITIAAVLLAGCGSEATPVAEKSKPKATPTATPEPASAYDEEILEKSEKDILRQMKAVVRAEGAKARSPVAHCIADSDRNFTCESTVTMEFDSGAYKFCASLDSTQRGNVDPDTGEFTWKNTGTGGDEEPYEC